jgi:CMP-N-acetylneuraminic acid synthetase
MFVWNMEKCRRLFTRTYVSSDSEAILEMAEDRGAIPIKRPLELCGDTPNIPVYRHALEYMDGVQKIFAVQANSPTLKESILYQAKSIMERYKFNELMTCHPGGKIYGSIWALTRERLIDYGDPYNPIPDILLLDRSTDIHTEDDLQKALLEHGK